MTPFTFEGEDQAFLLEGPFWDGQETRWGTLWIEDGRILEVYTGSPPALPSDLPVIRLPKEGLLIPGFVDTHTHMASYGLKLQRPDFGSVQSLEEFLEKLRTEVAEFRGRFLIGEGFDQSIWPENRLPTREELDRVTGKTPVIIRRVCGHVAVANTAALERIPKDVPGVDRQQGWLFEDVPLHLHKFVPPDFEEVKLGILAAQERLLALGITSVHDIGSPSQFRAYQELRQAGLLKIRVTFHILDRYAEAWLQSGITTGLGDDQLRVGGVKFFLDGSVGARTAAFFGRYPGHATTGQLNWRTPDLQRHLQKFHEHGLQVLCHAIGDRAIHQVVQIWKGILAGGNPLRHRIEHLEFPLEKDLDLMAKLGLYASLQPNFVARWGKPGALYDRNLGPVRWHRNNPFRQILDRGIRVAFGSDGMPYGPLYGLVGAVEHPNPEARISLKEALNLYTQAGTAFSFEEDQKGKLAKRYVADMVYLYPSPFHAPLDRVTIQRVWIGGRVVYMWPPTPAQSS